ARPLALRFNEGDGRFSGSTILDERLAITIATADLDGDGNTDIIAGNESTALLFHNAGGGQFGTPAELTLPLRLQRLAVADLDAAGAPAVFAAGIEGLPVLTNQGGTLVAGPMVYAPFVYPERVIPADIDNDGDLDVLLGDTSRLGVALNDGSGKLQEAQLL